ncbi:integrase core domain-containing protein [Corynebacterium spheniscorum]|uniref:integrase core domain-containing protein n=1 Tax=Corynebacterium spheniscorum TaxID=185761 RepID=UPI000B876672|nr:transposase [Corynebacterium spheniscorum]
MPPVRPWQNGFVESLPNRMREEVLEDNLLEDCAGLDCCLAAWSDRYNNYHPHSA